MLTSLLPGLRDFRTPFVTGSLYLLLVWIVFDGEDMLPDEDTTNTFMQRIYDLSVLLGDTATLAAVSLAAYLLGSLCVVRSNPFRKVVPPREQMHVLVSERVGIRFRRSSSGLSKEPLWRWQASPLPNRLKDLLLAVEEPDVVFTLPGTRDPNARIAVYPSGVGDWRTFADAILNAIEGELEDLATRLQIEREAIYNDYDRLRSEAELRYSIVIPLFLLVGAAAGLGHRLAAVGVILPIVLGYQGWRNQQAAETKVWQNLVAGQITSSILTGVEKAMDWLEANPPTEAERA